jgi:hypothetical protein
MCAGALGPVRIRTGLRPVGARDQTNGAIDHTVVQSTQYRAPLLQAEFYQKAGDEKEPEFSDEAWWG